MSITCRTISPSQALPQRYGAVRASVTAPNNSTPSDPSILAAAAIRFFARRGLPIAAEPCPAEDGVLLESRFDPSRAPLFHNVLALWCTETGCVTRDCHEAAAPGASDDPEGFRHAWSREERYQAHLDRNERDLGLRPCAGEGARWCQATEGSAEHVQELQKAFAALRADGRISRFPQRGIEVARQGTCTPYGLPAVLLRLKGSCRVFSERLGFHLLEASPRVISLTELSPGIVLAENTPPLDNVWDESRFWAAWQTLPAAGWDVVDAWAAVRVLRYVGTGEKTWQFYNHAHQPRNIVEHAADLPAAPGRVEPPTTIEADRWMTRRACEIALALRLDGRAEGGLRRHAIGAISTPYPFVHRPTDGERDIHAIETYLAKAATVLHWELLCEENADCVLTDKYRKITESAREGLAGILRGLITAKTCTDTPLASAEARRRAERSDHPVLACAV